MTQLPNLRAALLRHWPILACLVYFCLAGALLIPYPGVENDEALFANGVYAPTLMPGQIAIFGRTIPTMVMPYVGALKTWLYWAIFELIPPTPWTLRLPMVLAGAASIWFFYRFLYRIAGRRAALIGAVLLATDVSYLLTITFDRGPVAPQQFLVAAGLLLAIRGYQEREDWTLAAAFFVFGLALWDKLVFVWMFGGIAVAAAVLFHREILRMLTVRRVAMVSLAFLAGAAPLVLYNVQTGLGSFRGNEPTTAELGTKVAVMKSTLEGIVLARYLVDVDAEPIMPADATPIESASAWLRDLWIWPLKSLLPYALLLAVLLSPLAWRRPGWRALPFFAIAFAVAWAQMLFTHLAGGASHHTVLVWFLIIGFVAVSLGLAMDRLPRIGRGAIGTGIAAVVVLNVFLWNAHLAGLVRHGPAPRWSDALYPLVDYVKSLEPSVVYPADWGMDFSLRLFLEWTPPVREAINLHPAVLDEAERARMHVRLSQRKPIFVAYVDGKEVFPEGKRLVREAAEEEGYRYELLRKVDDSRGRPVFEVFRFVKDGG